MIVAAIPFLPGVGLPEIIILCVPVIVLAVIGVLSAIRSRRETPVVVEPPLPRAAWHTDPTGRHQLRYWDGFAWTSAVSDDGVQSEDAV